MRVVVVLGGKVLDHGGDPAQGLGLVVVQIGHQGRQTAVGVDQPARRLPDGGVDDGLVPGDLIPVPVTLVERARHDPGNVRQRAGGVHALRVLQAPLQPVHGADHRVFGTGLRRRLDHHDKHIRRLAVVLDNEAVVLVVLTVRSQLGGAIIQVTHLEILLVVHRHAQTDYRNQQRNGGDTGMREVGHEPPFAIRPTFVVLDMLDPALGDADVGHDHRMQHQVGDDDDCHTDTGGHRQIPDHVDLDEQQCQEAEGVTHQRHNAGDVQGPEGQTRAGQRVKALGRLQRHGIDHLHPVTDPDREHQERNKHRVGIQAITKQPQDTHLPEDRDDRDEHGHQRPGDATRVPEQEDGGQNDGDQGEQRNGLDAFDQVTHQLGKADDMDIDVRVLLLELLADLFLKLTRERPVIDGLAGFRVPLEKRRVDDGRLEVIRDQRADLPGTQDVVAQLFQRIGRAIVTIRNHGPALEPFLGHFLPANIRRPEGLQPGAVNPIEIEHLVGDLLQGLHVLFFEDIPVFVLHRDPYEVTEVREIVPVLHHIDDVGVLQRDQPLEAGIRLNLDRVIAKKPGQKQEDNQNDRPVIEDQALNHGFRARRRSASLAFGIPVRHSVSPQNRFLEYCVGVPVSQLPSAVRSRPRRSVRTAPRSPVRTRPSSGISRTPM